MNSKKGPVSNTKLLVAYFANSYVLVTPCNARIARDKYEKNIYILKLITVKYGTDILRLISIFTVPCIVTLY